jgi:predicted nucleic acid-binding protein
LQRQWLFKEADSYLDDFLNQFDTYAVRLTRPLLQRACEVAARYNLGSHDSLVVAIAYRVSVPDIAAIDGDFERPDNIYVWDDDIPRIRQQLKTPSKHICSKKSLI